MESEAEHHERWLCMPGMQHACITLMASCTRSGPAVCLRGCPELWRHRSTRCRACCTCRPAQRLAPSSQGWPSPVPQLAGLTRQCADLLGTAATPAAAPGAHAGRRPLSGRVSDFGRGCGRAQVSLAQLQYQLPRLTRMWSHLERQAGGRVRGMGEKQLEVDKRLMRTRIGQLQASLPDSRSSRCWVIVPTLAWACEMKSLCGCASPLEGFRPSSRGRGQAEAPHLTPRAELGPVCCAEPDRGCQAAAQRAPHTQGPGTCRCLRCTSLPELELYPVTLLCVEGKGRTAPPNPRDPNTIWHHHAPAAEPVS